MKTDGEETGIAKDAWGKWNDRGELELARTLEELIFDNELWYSAA